MTKTNIEWTQHTWNPMAGCSIVSPGCTNCYAMKTARRLEAMNAEARARGVPEAAPHYNGTTKIVNGKTVWTGKIGLSERALMKPLKRKKPTTWFVNSMSDLFHDGVPDESIDKVFAVMALTPQHTYQVLTKRSARMREYCSSDATLGRVLSLANSWLQSDGRIEIAHKADGLGGIMLPNVWLGVSTERQKEADERREPLRALAAQGWTTFVSFEPALGPIDWRGWEFLRWLISGGESGPGARPSHPDWHRAARDFCASRGIAYFFKQFGNWAPIPARDDLPGRPQIVRAGDCFILPDGTSDILDEELSSSLEGSAEPLRNVGKKAAGRLLDGVEHNGMPGAAR